MEMSTGLKVSQPTPRAFLVLLDSLVLLLPCGLKLRMASDNKQVCVGGQKGSVIKQALVYFMLGKSYDPV